MSATDQPAPVLAWHREAAQLIANEAVVGMTVKDFAELSARIIAAHDPHVETVRLLEEYYSHCEQRGLGSNTTPICETYRDISKRVRTHLAKLKGTQ